MKGCHGTLLEDWILITHYCINALPFAKSFSAPYLLDYTTTLTGKGVIFLNLNMKKLSFRKIKKPAQGHLAGKQGSWNSECKNHTLCCNSK